MTYLVHPLGLRALVFFSGIGIASAIVVMSGTWDGMTRLAGVMATLFIVFGLLAARNTEHTRRAEDEEALKDVRELAAQCVEIVGMIARMVASSETGDMPKALAHLSAKTTLLVTRYRRYLDPDTASMVMETEKIVVRAHVCGVINMHRFLRTLTRRVNMIRGGIREIDDPFLHRSRRAI